MTNLSTYSFLLGVLICIHVEGNNREAYPPGVPRSIYEASKTHLLDKQATPEIVPLSVPVNQQAPIAQLLPDQAPFVPIPQPAHEHNEGVGLGLAPGVVPTFYEAPAVPVPQPASVHQEQHHEGVAPGISPTLYEHQREEEEVEEDDEETVVDTGPAQVPKHQAPDTTSPQKEGDHQNRTPSVLEKGHVMDASDRQHLQQHLEIPLDTSNMSPLELAFHYFKLHDADKNQKLDGLELIQFIMHYAREDGNPPRIYTDEELISTVDHVLAQDDTNKDGYVSYGEFQTSYSGDVDES